MRTFGWSTAIMAVGAIAVAVATGWSAGRAFGRTPAPTAAPSAAESTAGRILFMRYCAFCHGPDGRGRGLPAGALSPPPTDLGGRVARRWTDQQLFAEISAGVPGTAMPAWGRILSDKERWEIVAFIRGQIQKG